MPPEERPLCIALATRMAGSQRLARSRSPLPETGLTCCTAFWEVCVHESEVTAVQMRTRRRTVADLLTPLGIVAALTWRRRVGPERAVDLGLRAQVEKTEARKQALNSPLFHNDSSGKSLDRAKAITLVL
jgi:hypothetical protein